MEIRDFISETLSAIVEGIKDAQPKVQEAGGAVNPKGCSYLNASSGTIMHKETTRIGQDVEFDIAVTVEEKTQSGGDMGVSIPIMKASFGGGSETQSGNVNRVKFKVPVIFPKSEYSE